MSRLSQVQMVRSEKWSWSEHGAPSLAMAEFVSNSANFPSIRRSAVFYGSGLDFARARKMAEFGINSAIATVPCPFRSIRIRFGLLRNV